MTPTGDSFSGITSRSTGQFARPGEPDRSDWDVIVIGAGLAGLTAAAYLTTNGLRTQVIEQWDVAGGYSHVFRRRGRFEFDVGVHYLGDCQPGGAIPTVLAGLGLTERITFLPMDPDGFDTLVFPDLTFRVPRGWDRYLDALIDTFPGEERALRRFIRIMRTIGQEYDRAIVPETLRQTVSFAARSPLTIYWLMRPLSALLNRCGLSVAAQAVLCGQSGDYGLAPRQAPSAVHAILLNHYVKTGGYFPQGGGQVLAAHLVDVITSHGGLVRTSTRVDRILLDQRRVTGVHLTNGETARARAVVSNADIKRTYFDLIGPEHLSPRLSRRVSNYRMASPFLIVYLGLDTDLAHQMPRTNYWVHNTTTAEGFFRSATPPAPGQRVHIDGMVMTCASVKDPTTPHIAPPGHSSLELIAYVPPDYPLWSVESGPAAGERYSRQPAYLAVKEQLTEDLISMATRVLPDLRDHIVWQEAGTPITQERYTLATGGSCLGIALTIDQMGLRRPRATSPLSGLYLTGSSTRSGPGVVGAMTGGIVTAGAILGRNLLAEVRNGAVFADPALLTAGNNGWDPLRASRRLGKDRPVVRVPEAVDQKSLNW
jgi:all-trans-retinol 13,14-reductase